MVVDRADRLEAHVQPGVDSDDDHHVALAAPEAVDDEQHVGEHAVEQ